MTPHPAPPPPPSWRKPAGALAICGLIVLWCVLVGSFAGPIGRWPIWVQTVFYVVTGIIWISPLKPLLRWMETGRWRSIDQPPSPRP